VNDLHDRLDNAFSAITPAPAPIDAAVRQGKRIRWRRRATATASAAALVAAGIAVPLAVHMPAAPPRPADGSYSVTARPPGPQAAAGLIATGTINGKGWEFSVTRPGTAGAGRGYQDVTASGSGFGARQTVRVPTVSLWNGSDPADLAATESPHADIQFGAVRADVTSVLVTLTNGTRLTLRPVAAFGTRLVAFGVPRGAVITDVTVYSARGEIATAIPYTFANGVPEFATWAKPGQHTLARGEVTFRGMFPHGAWSLPAHTGPWGICFDAPRGGICMPAVSPLGTRIIGTMSSNMNGRTEQLIVGAATARVARVVVTLDTRNTIRVTPQTVGGQAFFAFSTGTDLSAFDWTAYDAAGHQVASGQY
jgi:hypothetical protein